MININMEKNTLHTRADVITATPSTHQYTLTSLPNDYSILECTWPHAERILPGHFVTLGFDETPLYIFDAKPRNISLLIPPALNKKIQTYTSLYLSPIQGVPLECPMEGENPLMLLDDYSFSAGIFYLKKYRRQFSGVVLIGTEVGFPFHPCPSRHLTPTLPSHLIAANPLLEDWGMVNRLANIYPQPGCYEGTIKELAQLWQTQYPVMWDIYDLSCELYAEIVQ